MVLWNWKRYIWHPVKRKEAGFLLREKYPVEKRKWRKWNRMNEESIFLPYHDRWERLFTCWRRQQLNIPLEISKSIALYVCNVPVFFSLCRMAILNISWRSNKSAIRNIASPSTVTRVPVTLLITIYYSVICCLFNFRTRIPRCKCRIFIYLS